jgi:probable HAF family extracellular repeat protein
MFAMVFFGGVETALADPICSFTTIDVPGANEITAASAINDSGQIVGSFQDATRAHAFLASPGL